MKAYLLDATEAT